MKEDERTVAAASMRVAIERAGGPTKLAEQLGITQGAVSQWKLVPASRCADVERITGIRRESLRPDVFR